MTPLFESMFLSELSIDTYPGEIAKIIRKSRANNATNGLTGLLLFDGVSFCEFLEGPEWAVREAMAKIAVDPRHSAFQPLHNGTGSGKRRFEAWHVGILAPSGPSPLLAFRSLRGNAAADHLLTVFRDSQNFGIHTV